MLRLVQVVSCWLIGFLFMHASMAVPLIHIVAAENFYGAIAKELGGSFVDVTSILNQPDQDPHLFNVAPRIVKSVAEADLVVYNGLGYDPWMQSLLSASPSTKRSLICVASLVNKQAGDNPHIWYHPATMPLYAKALLNFLIKKDPKHRKEYQVYYAQFIKHFRCLLDQIAQLRYQYKGSSVIATEPVFGYMAAALGFRMQDIAFQNSIMNGIDPSPRQAQEFHNQLKQRRVKLLFYNKQVNNPLVSYLLQQAEQCAIPVIGVMETQPDNKTYIEWMQGQLKQVEHALHEQHSV